MPLVTFDNRDISTIVESGTNSNGSWIKYDNGVMIVWNSVTVTNQAISTSYTSGHYTGTRRMTFPQPFISLPTVTCSQFKWGTSGSWPSVSDVTLTDTSLRGMDTASRASGTSTYISYMAIGFWK